MMKRRDFVSPGAQSGATLLIALVMLVVMTLLGLASIRSTSMQERMGANLYDRSLAFQAVESALREAEATITVATVVDATRGVYCPATKVPSDGGRTCATPGPSATESEESGSSETYIERWADTREDTRPTWMKASVWWASVDTDMKNRLGHVTGTADRQPEYIIEYMGQFEDGTGCGQRGDTSCRGPRFRVTARMPPQPNLPNVVLQTNFRP